ncbi:hypothetical protein [Burkholderia guangdongensis]|uniref:hypothetical protein n=1 Tax=Burkholderia guangdongensis TaxID=1792500 RepID=UPI0015CCC565|nr:hypothetical protein [Burkholderia guangdongensis]
MMPDLAVPPVCDALPNPRGGAVRTAEMWLDAADDALGRHADIAVPMSSAAAALAEAGWLPAARFAGQLAQAALLVGTEPTSAGLRAALRDFRLTVARHNLREQACSPILFEHYRMLRAQSAADLGTPVPADALALVGRAVPPATLRPMPAAAVARLRARYEQALLAALRAHAPSDPALDEIDACMTELAGDDAPYDFWRLAAACMRALRASGAPELKRFVARVNLLLGEHARGRRVASPELVRETAALLWRDFALFGAAAEDVALVDVLHDYGLTVDWHVAGTSASEALWEADASRAELDAVAVAPTRKLGVVTVNAHAYEDFLQTADASMAELSVDPGAADAGAAWRAADAAYRVGAAACALGLGHTALLADTLGLAWRRVAHGAGFGDGGLSAHRHATDMMRAALLKIAAGVPPPDLTAACAALGATLGATQGGAGHA